MINNFKKLVRRCRKNKAKKERSSKEIEQLENEISNLTFQLQQQILGTDKLKQNEQSYIDTISQLQFEIQNSHCQSLNISPNLSFINETPENVSNISGNKISANQLEQNNKKVQEPLELKEQEVQDNQNKALNIQNRLKNLNHFQMNPNNISNTNFQLNESNDKVAQSQGNRKSFSFDFQVNDIFEVDFSGIMEETLQCGRCQDSNILIKEQSNRIRELKQEISYWKEKCAQMETELRNVKRQRKGDRRTVKFNESLQEESKSSDFFMNTSDHQIGQVYFDQSSLEGPGNFFKQKINLIDISHELNS